MPALGQGLFKCYNFKEFFFLSLLWPHWLQPKCIVCHTEHFLRTLSEMYTVYPQPQHNIRNTVCLFDWIVFHYIWMKPIGDYWLHITEDYLYNNINWVIEHFYFVLFKWSLYPHLKIIKERQKKLHVLPKIINQKMIWSKGVWFWRFHS